MASIVVMPKVGISVESCIVTKWHKSKGDKISSGETIFTYETDKASVDEEAKVSGVLLHIFAQEGDDVPVLENVCIIGEENEDISTLIAKKEVLASEKIEVTSATTTPVAVSASSDSNSVAVTSATTTPIEISANSADGRLKASPRAKNLAEKTGVDLLQTNATGPYGRIIEADVREMINSGKTYTKAALNSEHNSVVAGSGIGGKVTTSDLNKTVIITKEEATVTSAKLSNIRKVIGKSMMSSLANSAQLTNNASFDATSMMNFRKDLKASDVTTITINDILLYAVSRTLKNHRDLNANLIDDTMYYYDDVNLGIAVDTPRGLLVPTLFGADKMSLSEISANAKELIAKAKEGNISPDLLRGGTFTITNLGSLGVESFTPVINPPQTGILGVCAIVDKVKEVNGELKLYKSMGLSLTYDHRVVDGAPAAKFILELKQNLESIPLLLIK